MNPSASEAPELLGEGTTVVVPEARVRRTSVTKPHVIVRKGDTLWSLARTHLGRGAAWQCLASANPEVTDYTRLSIGSILLLPSDETLASCKLAAPVPPMR